MWLSHKDLLNLSIFVCTLWTCDRTFSSWKRELQCNSSAELVSQLWPCFNSIRLSWAESTFRKENSSLQVNFPKNVFSRVFIEILQASTCVGILFRWVWHIYCVKSKCDFLYCCSCVNVMDEILENLVHVTYMGLHSSKSIVKCNHSELARDHFVDYQTCSPVWCKSTDTRCQCVTSQSKPS